MSVTRVTAEPVAKGYELVKEQGDVWVVKGKRRSPLGTPGMFELREIKVDHSVARKSRTSGVISE